MGKDIQAEIEKFRKIEGGVGILEQAILSKGAENLTEEDLEELRELETGKEKYIPKEQMERLVFLEIAKPLSYSGIKDVFRSVGHFTYRLIEGGKRPGGWYPLSDNFFKRR